jgi:TRAP-type C4-dicarboxylate transport system permease small subunit
VDEASRIPKWIRAVRRFNTVTHYVSGAALLVILFLTVADITGRSGFSRPVPGTVEVTSMLLVVVVFLAVAHSEDKGDHITIDLVYERVGRGTKWLFDVFADSLTFIVMAFIAYQLYQFGLRNIDSGAETPVLDWPVWPFVFVGAFGAAMYAVSTVMRVVLRVKGLPVNAVDVHDDDGGIEI